MKTKNIQHELEFDFKPEDFFNAFMDSGIHSKFTGMEAQIENFEGGWFTTCGKRNFGYTLKLIPHLRIIQAWSHKDFPQNHFSIIDLRLLKSETGLKLIFNHYAVPEECYQWLDEGWQSTYWEAMKKYFSK